MPWVWANRGPLVSAFVAVAKMGMGVSATKLPTMGSYEDYVSVLASTLEGNGYEGFLEGREDDREFSESEGQHAFQQFVAKWIETYGGEKVPFPQLLEIAQSIPSLAPRDSRDGKIGSRALGYLLRANRGRVIEAGDYKAELAKTARSGSERRWQLLGNFPKKETEEYLPYAENEPESVF